MLDWQDEIQDPLASTSPVLALQVHVVTLSFMWVLGIKTQVLRILQQTLSYLPAAMAALDKGFHAAILAGVGLNL